MTLKASLCSRSTYDAERLDWMSTVSDPLHASEIGHAFLKSIFLVSHFPVKNKTEITEILRKNSFQRMINQWKAVIKILDNIRDFSLPFMPLHHLNNDVHVDTCAQNSLQFIMFLRNPSIREAIFQLPGKNVTEIQEDLEVDSKIWGSKNDSLTPNLEKWLNDYISAFYESNSTGTWSMVNDTDNLNQKTNYSNRYQQADYFKSLLRLIKNRSNVSQLPEFEFDLPAFDFNNLQMLLKCLHSNANINTLMLFSNTSYYHSFHSRANLSLFDAASNRSTQKHFSDHIDIQNVTNPDFSKQEREHLPVFNDSAHNKLLLKAPTLSRNQYDDQFDESLRKPLETALVLLEDTNLRKEVEHFLNILKFGDKMEKLDQYQQKHCNVWIHSMKKHLQVVQESGRMGLVFDLLLDEISNNFRTISPKQEPHLMPNFGSDLNKMHVVFNNRSAALNALNDDFDKSRSAFIKSENTTDVKQSSYSGFARNILDVLTSMHGYTDSSYHFGFEQSFELPSESNMNRNDDEPVSMISFSIWMELEMLATKMVKVLAHFYTDNVAGSMRSTNVHDIYTSAENQTSKLYQEKKIKTSYESLEKESPPRPDERENNLESLHKTTQKTFPTLNESKLDTTVRQNSSKFVNNTEIFEWKNSSGESFSSKLKAYESTDRGK